MKPRICLDDVDGMTLREIGNIFAIAAQAGVALKRAGRAGDREELYRRLPASKSFEEALQLIMEYVDVE